MPVETINMQNVFREYDGLVGLTMLNIYSLSKTNQEIILYNFDRKDTEHLYFLRVALLARSIYGFDVKIHGSWWDIFCINWKIGRGFEKIKRHKGELTKECIDVPDVLAFMRPDGIRRFGKDFTFAEIYKQYYERNFR